MNTNQATTNVSAIQGNSVDSTSKNATATGSAKHLPTKKHNLLHPDSFLNNKRLKSQLRAQGLAFDNTHYLSLMCRIIETRYEDASLNPIFTVCAPVRGLVEGKVSRVSSAMFEIRPNTLKYDGSYLEYRLKAIERAGTDRASMAIKPSQAPELSYNGLFLKVNAELLKNFANEVPEYEVNEVEIGLVDNFNPFDYADTRLFGRTLHPFLFLPQYVVSPQHYLNLLARYFYELNEGDRALWRLVLAEPGVLNCVEI